MQAHFLSIMKKKHVHSTIHSALHIKVEEARWMQSCLMQMSSPVYFMVCSLVDGVSLVIQAFPTTHFPQSVFVSQIKLDMM